VALTGGWSFLYPGAQGLDVSARGFVSVERRVSILLDLLSVAGGGGFSVVRAKVPALAFSVHFLFRLLLSSIRAERRDPQRRTTTIGKQTTLYGYGVQSLVTEDREGAHKAQPL
jgi:hypothetical protein